MTKAPVIFQDPQDCVDALLERLGTTLKIGAPLGLGKSIPLLNAIYERVAADPSLSLRLFTALTLNKPAVPSGLAARLAGPIIERLYGEYPGLAYGEARRKGTLPKNIRVYSFFLPTGQCKGNLTAQQDYISSNYSHAARDLCDRDINAVVQMISPPVEKDGVTYYSLGCNPDLTLDLKEAYEAAGKSLLLVGHVNRKMPVMKGGALIPADHFDYLLDEPTLDTQLFPLPAPAVNATAHMIGLHASTLISDGGTLQIGIGALGDSLVHALLLRHLHNDEYQDILRDTGALPTEETSAFGGVTPLNEGLYASTEMFVHGFLQLYQHGILQRRVYEHPTLQRWALQHAEAAEVPVAPALLTALHEDGAVSSPLTEADVLRLQVWGILQPGWTWEADSISHKGQVFSASVGALVTSEVPGLWGTKLQGGSCLHAGFFLGPDAMYQTLRDMPERERDDFKMSRISLVNTLRHERDLLVLQRQRMRCMNISMMHTLLGAAVSDGIRDGQVISGVGGQFDFVSMAQELSDGRSVLMQPSTRLSKGEWHSTIVWEYEHTTIPRHMRDIVITEYGVAVLRGKTDQECIQAMLCIADSRFQETLRQRAVEAGKLAADYQIPQEHRNNYPERIEAALGKHQRAGWLPLYPLGTALAEEEVLLARALQGLKDQINTWEGRWSTLGSFLGGPSELVDGRFSGLVERALARMDLASPSDLKERVLRRLLRGSLFAYLDKCGHLHNPEQRHDFPLVGQS